MRLDSTKTLQGMITPSLNFQTDKENVLTFKNSANLNILIHRNRVVNILNKFEFSSYGKNVAPERRLSTRRISLFTGSLL